RRSRADWAWGCPSAARSSTITGDVSGRRRTRATAPPFTSLCRGSDDVGCGGASALRFRSSKHANEDWSGRDDHRDAEERNRRRRRHALGHAHLSLLRDESGSPRYVGLLLQGWIGKPRVLPVGGGRAREGGRGPARVETSRS